MTASHLYFDLVVETVRGRSPIPELQRLSTDRVPLARAHLDQLRARYDGKPAGNDLIDGVLEAGPDFLAMLWDKMSPAALTMCGDLNIGFLITAMKTIAEEKVPGDFIETGVWRGGLPIVMRAFLELIEDRERIVWVADSFRGLPEAADDENDRAAHALLEPLAHLATKRIDVEKAFDFFKLRDSQVRFLEGWFSDTLKTLPARPLALARLDGDYYESTRDAIEELYPRLSPGGYLIVDDYHLPLGCKRAIDEYRSKNGIATPLVNINSQSVFWRKPASGMGTP